MRLLRRNTTKFLYRKNLGEREKLVDGYHSGTFETAYDNPVEYRGNISPANGVATTNLFGTNVNYTHTLLMDKPDADIDEYGVVEWNGNQYDVTAVRRSLNVFQAALKQRTKSHNVTVVSGNDV